MLLDSQIVDQGIKVGQVLALFPGHVAWNEARQAHWPGRAGVGFGSGTKTSMSVGWAGEQ